MTAKTDATQKNIGKTDEQPNNVYQSLIEHTNDAVAYCKILFDKEGNPIDYVFLDVNLAFKRLTRLEDRQLRGKKGSQLTGTLYRAHMDWIDKYGRTVFTRKSVTLEKHIPKLGRWFNFTAFIPQRGFFAIIIKDITLRRKTEGELRQSEKKYKKLAGSINEPFFALDSSLKFSYWNKASEKTTGLTNATMVGKHFFEVFGRKRDTRKLASVALDVMRTKKPRVLTDKFPMTDEKTVFELEINPTGNGVSVLAKNVTKTKKMQASLEEYTKHLEEKVRLGTERLKNAERLAAIGETAGMIGHDIRNPLQSIIGEVFLAKNELEDVPEGETKENLLFSINLIEEQTLYINKIVTDLQDYAKPLTPAIQECDFEEVIQEIALHITAPDNIKIAYGTLKPFPTLKTDPSFIKRILTNLVRNGVQAMEEKGGTLRVNAFPRQESIIIAVADTGTGISEEAKERIFKPLFTTKSKGQGFGLAVVKKLVDALEGNVSYETKLGKGTTFIVELPLRHNGLT